MEVLNVVIKPSKTYREVRNLFLSTEVNTAMLCLPQILHHNYQEEKKKKKVHTKGVLLRLLDYC